MSLTPQSGNAEAEGKTLTMGTGNADTVQPGSSETAVEKKTLTPRPGSPEAIERKTAALLGGCCLFLSALEYLIPKPLPFLRIGLANLPLLLALDILSFKYFSLLALIKVFGQGIISGTLVSYLFLFSLAGTGASAGGMYLLRRLGGKRVSYIGVGAAGAVISNAVQLLLARFFVFGEGVRFLIPLFLGAGTLTGAALGLFCETFTPRSRWYFLNFKKF